MSWRTTSAASVEPRCHRARTRWRDYASDALAPDGPRRLDELPSRGRQLRRHGRPGAGRHRARPCRAPRPRVHLTRRRRWRFVSAARARVADGRGTRRDRGAPARHPLHAGVAGDASARRGAGRARGRSGEPKSDEQRNGEREQLEARRHHDVSVTARARSPARRWSRTASTTASRRRRTASTSPRTSPTPSCAVYEGGHLFFIQDRTALPDVIGFLAEP